MLNIAEAKVSLDKDNLGKPTLETYKEQILNVEKIVTSVSEITTDAEGNRTYEVSTSDEYVFQITEIVGTNVNDIIIDYKGNKKTNEAPTEPSASVSSKTTNSITVSASATDPDANNLTYQLYVGEELKATSNATASGAAVTLTANDLLEYTDYNYYVIVTDGFLSNTGTTQTVRTYCSGTSIPCTPTYCSGGTDFYCNSCQGVGEAPCSNCSNGSLNCSGTWRYYTGSSAGTCQTCGMGVFTTLLRCDGCGKSGGYYTCSCGAFGDEVGLVNESHDDLVDCSQCSPGVPVTCSDCDGVGSYDNPCDHSLYNEHYQCTHNSNTSSTTHYYCDHNTAGKQHD